MFLPSRVRNFERVSGLSRWFRTRFTAAGQLLFAVTVASGVIGVDTSRNLSYQIFALSLSMIVLAMILANFNRGRFSCTRTLPSIATVGEPVHYCISITNTGKTAQSDLLIVDCLTRQSPTAQEFLQFRDPQSSKENWFDRSIGFPRWNRLVKLHTGAVIPDQSLSGISIDENVTVPLSLTPLRRGYIRFQGVDVGFPGINGIFRSFYRQNLEDSLLVLPKRYPVPKLALPGHRHHHQGGVALSSAVGETAEFHGLRDYRPGDPLRHVHWRSWARTGKPVVKKYEDEYFVRHALILDTYGGNASTAQFEEAVSVASSLALSVNDQESLLDLMFVDRQAYRITSGRHTADLPYLLEILACVKPEYNEPFETLTHHVRQHSDQLSSTICIFLGWDAPRKALVKALTDSGTKVVVIVITETESVKAERDKPGDMTDLEQAIHWLPVDAIEEGLARLVQIEGGHA